MPDKAAVPPERVKQERVRETKDRRVPCSHPIGDDLLCISGAVAIPSSDAPARSAFAWRSAREQWTCRVSCSRKARSRGDRPAAGIAAAPALGRLLTALLYEISPHNPLLPLATAGILSLAALLACLLPARKATRLDPVQALRAE